MIDTQEKEKELTKHNVWVVAKAATSGVVKYEKGTVEWCDIYKAFRVTVLIGTDVFGYKYRSWTLGTEAFLTKEEAVKAARLLIERKLACLKRQIDKLEAYNKKLEESL